MYVKSACAIILSCSNKVKNYNKIRKKFRKKLKEIDVFFKSEINFNAKNILFPHTWQLKPKKDNKNYQLIIEMNLKRRVEILKATTKFVWESKRFSNDEKI